jgi:hypothetical protein
MFPMNSLYVYHAGHYMISFNGPVIILWLLQSVMSLQLSGPVLYLLRTPVIFALCHGYSVETYYYVLPGCFCECDHGMFSMSVYVLLILLLWIVHPIG